MLCALFAKQASDLTGGWPAMRPFATLLQNRFKNLFDGTDNATSKDEKPEWYFRRAEAWLTEQRDLIAACVSLFFSMYDNEQLILLDQ